MSTNTNPNFTLKPIDDLKDHHFFIPDYQRGYKWDVQQVLDLLEDIDEFEQIGSSFYCLQPLAVTALDTSQTYEVIDGQQRLTTVHIILQIIGDSIYTIEYETRNRSGELLKTVASSEHFGEYSVDFTEKVEDLKIAINTKWADYIKGKNNEFDNIDFYYFFTAFLTVKAWFEYKRTDKEEFKGKLLKQTKFIWYNETNEKKPKKVFRNLNSGKIPLTNAELIKALFVNDLKDENKEIQQLKQSALAREWDMIETTLQDDEFWYFINNTNANKYATRIDFLFELLAKERPKGNVDELFTYREYAELAKKQKSRLNPENWNVIKSLFLKLREWYEDNELYHLIGYLTASWNSNIKSLVKITEIVEKSQGKGKAAFKKYLIDEIGIKLFLKNNVSEALDIKAINYDNDKAFLNRILLLHNIETYQKNMVGFRFPFFAFKYRKEGDKLKRNVWSLEHIHAQQADKVETVGAMKDWIGEGFDTIIKEVENEIDNEKYTKLKENTDELKKSYEEKEGQVIKDTDKITERQKELLIDIERHLEMHQIWNMALLEKDTNSGLGKKSFSAKREKIIKKVTNNEAFIPIGTRNVFLKVYTKKLPQINYWNYQDRNDYLEDIKEKLAVYIQPKKA